jgi:hypothetical protein
MRRYKGLPGRDISEKSILVGDQWRLEGALSLLIVVHRDRCHLGFYDWLLSA